MILKRIIPRRYYILKLRKSSWSLRYLVSFYYAELKLFINAKNRRVCSGPFKGMTYCGRSVGIIYPKLLGTFEMELHEIISALIAKGKFETIVNIGAAEGYYACGFAMTTKARIIAFETIEEGRLAIKEMLSLNDLHGIYEIKGFCDVDALNKCLTVNSLLIMDVEGGEIQLLDPAKIPLLRYQTILVEAHDCIIPNATEIIKSRFSKTHEIKTISSRKRQIKDFPLSIRNYERFFEVGFLTLMDENRPEMNWLLLTPIGNINC